MEYTPPTHTLQAILSAGDAKNADRAATGEFFGQFFALYNALGEHQDAGYPFRLFKFPTVDSPEGLRKKLGHRQHELKELMPLFTASPSLSNRAGADRRIALIQPPLGTERRFLERRQGRSRHAPTIFTTPTQKSRELGSF